MVFKNTILGHKTTVHWDIHRGFLIQIVVKHPTDKLIIGNQVSCQANQQNQRDKYCCRNAPFSGAPRFLYSAVFQKFDISLFIYFILVFQSISPPSSILIIREPVHHNKHLSGITPVEGLLVRLYAGHGSL